MSSPFVRFQYNGQNSRGSRAPYGSIFAWKSSKGPGGMAMLAADNGHVVAVDDADAATMRAASLGATLLREQTRGRAGELSVVHDPRASALWKEARA